jgi:hypothetical protein
MCFQDYPEEMALHWQCYDCWCDEQEASLVNGIDEEDELYIKNLEEKAKQHATNDGTESLDLEDLPPTKKMKV